VAIWARASCSFIVCMSLLRFFSVFINGLLCFGLLSRGLGLPRPAARPLAGDDHSLDDQLAPPDAPRLAPRDGALQALGADRAGPAERLGELHVTRRLGEEQLGVLPVARQLLLVDAHAVKRRVEDGDTHLFSSCVVRVDRW
jgi:hypothetical protein